MILVFLVILCVLLAFASVAWFLYDTGHLDLDEIAATLDLFQQERDR